MSVSTPTADRRRFDHFKKAMRLSPLDPLGHTFKSGIGLAYMTDRQYDEALHWVDLALAEQPKFVGSLRMRAAALAMLGRIAEAKDALRALLAVAPSLTIAGLTQGNWRGTTHHAEWIEILRGLGVPDA